MGSAIAITARESSYRYIGPKLRESKFTHDYAQVQKLFTGLTGGIPLTFGCAERHKRERGVFIRINS